MQFKKLPVGDKMWKILCQFQVYLLHTHTQGKRKADRGGEIENTCKIHPSNAWHRALAAFNPTAMYPSVSIHLFPHPPPPLSLDCSKLLIHSMPSQMVSRTVKACSTWFQHSSNKPSSQLQMACLAWFWCHRGTATISLWLNSRRLPSVHTCVWVEIRALVP